MSGVVKEVETGGVVGARCFIVSADRFAFSKAFNHFVEVSFIEWMGFVVLDCGVD